MAVSKGKATKILSRAFVENVSEINEDEARDMIISSEKKIREIKMEMDSDEKLAAARQIAKDLNSGYNNAIRYEKAKISHLLDKIDELTSDEPNTDGIDSI